MSAEARAATAFVNAEAEEGWYTTPSIQDARAKDIAHRNMLRMAQSDPNTVMAVLLRDPEALVNEAQEIMHHEWEVAKKAPSVISPFTGQPRRLEPELMLGGPPRAPPAKAPQPSIEFHPGVQKQTFPSTKYSATTFAHRHPRAPQTHAPTTQQRTAATAPPQFLQQSTCVQAGRPGFERIG